jgi:hypothetical protein
MLTRKWPQRGLASVLVFGAARPFDLERPARAFCVLRYRPCSTRDGYSQGQVPTMRRFRDTDFADMSLGQTLPLLVAVAPLGFVFTILA